MQFVEIKKILNGNNIMKQRYKIYYANILGFKVRVISIIDEKENLIIKTITFVTKIDNKYDILLPSYTSTGFLKLFLGCKEEDVYEFKNNNCL